MRDIKFRAWVKKPKYGMDEYLGMFYGVERAYDTLGSMMDSSGNERNYPWQSFSEILESEESGKLVLMQFTGLLDKNGKEIYEGDIVKYKEENCEVKWTDFDYCFGWYFFPKHEPYTWETNGLHNPWEKVEVVGNIYENSDLLK